MVKIQEHSSLILFFLRFASHTKLIAVLYVVNFIFCAQVFHALEHRSWFDSIYWCMATWFTVGYGDIFPHSHAGKVFSIYAIISSHVLIILLTANFIAKMSQYRKEIRRLGEYQVSRTTTRLDTASRQRSRR